MDYMMKELVEKSKAGDNYSKEEIINSLMPLVIKSIKSYYFGDEEFLDLIQEGCIKILEAIERYDEKTEIPFLGYVKARLKYFYLNKRKKSRRETSLDKQINKENSNESFIDILEDEGANIEKNFIKKEDYKALVKILNTLTKNQKRIIELCYKEKFTMRQISKELGLHYQTISKTKIRALNNMRKLISKDSQNGIIMKEFIFKKKNSSKP